MSKKARTAPFSITEFEFTLAPAATVCDFCSQQFLIHIHDVGHFCRQCGTSLRELLEEAL